MTEKVSNIKILSEKPQDLSNKVRLSLLAYSESSFTDPHTVVSLDEPAFDEAAYSHIGKIYEGVEPYRMGVTTWSKTQPIPKIVCTILTRITVSISWWGLNTVHSCKPCVSVHASLLVIREVI